MDTLKSDEIIRQEAKVQGNLLGNVCHQRLLKHGKQLLILIFTICLLLPGFCSAEHSGPILTITFNGWPVETNDTCYYGNIKTDINLNGSYALFWEDPCENEAVRFSTKINYGGMRTPSILKYTHDGIEYIKIAQGIRITVIGLFPETDPQNFMMVVKVDSMFVDGNAAPNSSQYMCQEYNGMSWPTYFWSTRYWTYCGDSETWCSLGDFSNTCNTPYPAWKPCQSMGMAKVKICNRFSKYPKQPWGPWEMSLYADLAQRWLGDYEELRTVTEDWMDCGQMIFPMGE